ncbi:hypothetical protein Tco_1242511 [Tanacetum coccineum]
MTSTHQQSLADARSETRPSMLERGSYVLWESWFIRYIERNKDTRKFLKCLIEEGPYKFKDISATATTTITTTQKEDDFTGDDLKQYELDIKAMNLILLSIPNDIYNSMDACETTKDTWDKVKRLMQGTDLSKIERESWFINEFDKFTSKAGESLSFVFNRFSRLVNDLDRNKIKPIKMAVNTKFLNSLQLECCKYVTNVRLSKNLAEDSYDSLFDHLQQYEGIVNAFRAKRVAKTHDPLDLVPNTYESHYARDCLKPRVQDSKYFLEQILLAKKDEAGIILINENNDFLLANASEIEEFKDLSPTICMMA